MTFLKARQLTYKENHVANKSDSTRQCFYELFILIHIPDLFWGLYFQFFFLECYGSDNQPLGTEQIYEQLKNIVNQSNEPDVPVGLLTTENRNKWAKAYELLAKGKQG